jgi:hypothetical protein
MGDLLDSAVSPEKAAVLGGQRVDLIVDGDGEDPPAADRRGRAHRRRQALRPDHLAARRIEREDLGETRGDIEPIRLIGDAAAEEAGPLVVGLEIDAPDLLAALGIVRGHDRARVHGENTVPNDQGLRQEPLVVVGALADIGTPPDLQGIAQRQVIHGVVRGAADLGPVLVDRGRRQLDLELRNARVLLDGPVEGHDGDALAGQGVLVALAEPSIAEAAARQQQAAGQERCQATDHLGAYSSSASSICEARARNPTGAARSSAICA